MLVHSYIETKVHKFHFYTVFNKQINFLCGPYIECWLPLTDSALSVHFICQLKQSEIANKNTGLLILDPAQLFLKLEPEKLWKLETTQKPLSSGKALVIFRAHF